MAIFTESNALLTPDAGSLPFPRLAGEATRLTSVRHLDTTPLILGQNAPNPHQGETTIPFTLLHPADVRLEIFDLLGRKMAAVVRKGLGSGEHCIQLNLRGLCLPYGDYPYHLHATTSHGVHSLNRSMTLSFTLAVAD
ncbi:MAG: hypothetical protein M3Y54_15115 [Bacteroidota bacterium]|nr:hypothetical protein [Bacteroidota bacterium]